MFEIKVSKNKESFGVEIYLDGKMVGFANSSWNNRFFESNLLTCGTQQMYKEINRWLRKENLAVRAIGKATLVFNPNKLMEKDVKNTRLYEYNSGITYNQVLEAKRTYDYCRGEEKADDFFREKTIAERNKSKSKEKRKEEKRWKCE